MTHFMRLALMGLAASAAGVMASPQNVEAALILSDTGTSTVSDSNDPGDPSAGLTKTFNDIGDQITLGYSGIPTPIIIDETIINNTGVDWGSYHFESNTALIDGGSGTLVYSSFEVRFDQFSDANVSVPVTNITCADDPQANEFSPLCDFLAFDFVTPLLDGQSFTLSVKLFQDNPTPASHIPGTLSFIQYASLAEAITVPEPASLAIFAVGLAGLGFGARRRRNRRRPI